MPDPAMTAALKEAYATAGADVVVYHTLELWHPAFTVPIRVVRDLAPLKARLEASAPRDAGALVTFLAYAFDVVPPEQTSMGGAQMTITIDNVSREIGARLDEAIVAGEPIVAIYREFIDGETDEGPEYDPPLHLTVLGVEVTIQAGQADLLNAAYPRGDYDLERFPGLAA